MATKSGYGDALVRKLKANVECINPRSGYVARVVLEEVCGIKWTNFAQSR